MSDLFWLTDEQMERLLLSGIVFVNRNGLRWRGAPREYGSHKTLYKWWGEAGVFTRMMDGLAAVDAEPKIVMIDATPAFAGAGST